MEVEGVETKTEEETDLAEESVPVKTESEPVEDTTQDESETPVKDEPVETSIKEESAESAPEAQSSETEPSTGVKKEETEAAPEEEVPELKTEEDAGELKDEKDAADFSLNDDGAANEQVAVNISAPAVTGGIKINITSKVEVTKPALDRQESTASGGTVGPAEDDPEFDKDAIIVPRSADWEERKPKMKGKKFQDIPMTNKDSELSGLCSIM